MAHRGVGRVLLHEHDHGGLMLPRPTRRRVAIARRSPRGSRGAQLRLLLGMLRRLTADDWTPDELAEDLGICRRTAWRYLAAIRAQCPLECARERGVGGVSSYRLPRRWWGAA